jgi:hypothetical protein
LKKKFKPLSNLKLHIFFILSLFLVIEKAMGAPTSDLQDFLELQMQKSNEKIVYSQYLKL